MRETDLSSREALRSVFVSVTECDQAQQQPCTYSDWEKLRRWYVRTRPSRRCKVFVYNKWSQKVKNFKYLGCEISYEDGKRYSIKLAKFAQMFGILNNTFKPTLVQKFSRIKVYNALALPIRLRGSEIWTVRQQHKKRLTSIETKFFRRKAGYIIFNTKVIKKLCNSWK